MEWIDVTKELPSIENKYLVKTKTSKGNQHRLDAHLSITNGKASFNVTNQVVTHWLKEN